MQNEISDCRFHFDKQITPSLRLGKRITLLTMQCAFA